MSAVAHSSAPRFTWPWALAALAAWAVMLATMARLPDTGVAVLAVEAAGLFLLMRALAPARHRAAVDAIFAVALLAYTLEVLALQSLPAWSDAFPDSTRYDRNARALVLHWQGQAVPTADYLLKGLRFLGVAEWPPGDAYDYTQALGMSRYLYQLLLAGIYALTDGSRTTAVFANVPFLAAAAGGTYLLAYSLFGGTVARLAAALVVLDTNFAVWGSVLLRESLLLFLVVLAFLSTVRMLKGEGRTAANLAVGSGAIGLLTLVRFNAVAALLLAGFAALPARMWLPAIRRLVPALAGLALLGFLLARAFPGLAPALENSLPGQVAIENLNILRSGELVLNAATGSDAGREVHVNAVRQEWHTALREQPLWLNGLKALTRSLMGPYPWVALTRGLSGENFYELMYPGMALWLLFLPAFLYALWRLPFRDEPALRLCVAWLALVALIYIVGYGQLGGRERMMAQPLLWILAAEGARRLWRRGVAEAPA
jgi:4-amino-4-deoxy-L-arabinose transferase-like glycosyltransferase